MTMINITAGEWAGPDLHFSQLWGEQIEVTTDIYIYKQVAVTLGNQSVDYAL